MSAAQQLIGILILAASGIAFSQSNEVKGSDKAANADVGSQPPTSPIATPCEARAAGEPEILTDTMGVDFGPYLTGICKTVRQTWYKLMPPKVYPPIRTHGKVSIEFLIHKNGKVSSMKIQTSSGDVALDRSAW